MEVIMVAAVVMIGSLVAEDLVVALGKASLLIFF